MENPNIDLRSLQFFLEVYQSQSFSAVARLHNLSVPIITRAINQLEESLQQPLFYRNTRAITPTASGHLFADYAKTMLQQFKEMQQSLGELKQTPSGLIRIHTPIVFGQLHIAPHLSGLLARYPNLNVELIQQDTAPDFHRAQLDLAFSITDLPDSRLKIRSFAKQQYVLCGAPSYLAQQGLPQDLSELNAHRCLMYKGANGLHQWLFRKGNAPWQRTHLQPAIASNNILSLVNASVAGAGLIMFPQWLLGKEIRAGKLQPIFRDYQVGYQIESQFISAVYPNTKQPALNVRAVLDYFIEIFENADYWQNY